MIWRLHIHKVVLRLPDSRSNWNLEMLFLGRGENWRRRRWDLNPGQINGRRVLSPLRYPLLPKEGENRLGSVAKLNESISPSNIKFQITPLLALIFLSDVKLVYL